MDKIRTFGIRLVLLLIVLVCVDGLAGKVLEHYYLKVRTGSEYKTVYAVEKSDEDLLVLGSSRAYHHYVIPVLERGLKMEGYNLGRDGAGILYDYAVYKTICRRKYPKLIIMDLNPEEFMSPNVSYQLLYQLLPHYRKNSDIREVVNLRSPYESWKAKSALYRFNSQLFYIALNSVQHPDVAAYKGYLPLEGFLVNAPGPVQQKASGVDTLLVHYFEKFLQEARRNSTRVVVCVSPIYKKYGYTTSSITRAGRLCGQYGVRMFDFSQDTTFGNHPDQYFRDISHLNNNGATLYTQKIRDTITAVYGY